jgi:hypothetical protein
MKNIRFYGVTVGLIMAIGQAALAEDRFQASLNFLVGFPQNDFRQNVDRTFYGMSGEFFYNLPRSPLSIGVGLEYLNYGSETRIEPFSHEIPDVLVDVTTRNSLFSGTALLRLSPPDGLIRPYVEAFIGFNYLFTYTSLNDDGDWSEEIATTTNLDDWGFTFGAGAGALIRALDIRSRAGQSLFSLFVEAGVRYYEGTTAAYLKEGSMHREHGSLWYEPMISDTDLLKTRLGIVFRF